MRTSCLLLLGSLFFFQSCYVIHSSKGGGQTNNTTRTINASDVALVPGYKIEAVASGLTFPTAATFDAEGNLFVIEAGYSYGEVFLTPKLIRIASDGSKTTIAEGSKNGPWTNVTYHQGNFYVSEGGQLEGGKILRITPQGQITALVENLPSLGDHHTNGLVVGPDGYLYFGQGAATNSGVVGLDNQDFGWLERHPDFRDIPCRDIKLVGQNFTTDNILTTNNTTDKITTGAFMPFGTSVTAGQIVAGSVPCSGAIMRIPLAGGTLEVVAWGFRNPYGLAFDPNGQLFVTDNGFDVRGSRPVWGAGDYLWKVEPDTWYGWPDFSGGLPIHYETFNVPGGDNPEFILAEHPNKPPHSVVTLDVHSSSNGIDFSRSDAFGYKGQAFIAQFGDMAPNVGKVWKPVGYRIVRVDTEMGRMEEFVANKGKVNGPASWQKSGGLERPISVRFSPDGTALYVVDFGILLMDKTGPKPQEQTGMIWKVTKE